MTQIKAKDVKTLRDMTGAGMMDCKGALVDASGDLEKAVDLLRKRGVAGAAKKAGRSTNEGLVFSYIHGGGRIGTLVQVNCETDFVARTDDFQALCKDLAMHVAASSPLCVKREDLPEDELARERDIYLAQAKDSGKPEKIWEKIVEGRMNKFFGENCFLEQPFIKDDSKTVGEVVKEAIAKLGENIEISRFTRFQIGG